MQLPDRRRPGGSRRWKSVRSILTRAFGSPISDSLALAKVLAPPPFERCEPPRRRRYDCIVPDYSVLQTELRRRFPGTPIIVATIAADWGASYLPPAELYDKKIYQESIAVVAAGGLEQLIESVATRIASALAVSA